MDHNQLMYSHNIRYGSSLNYEHFWNNFGTGTLIQTGIYMLVFVLSPAITNRFE